MSLFFGKHRGVVVNNVDPRRTGRVQVSVPSVLGEGRLSWALPCVPYAGPGVGFFALPPEGANVWVEFERGDPNFPIWTGCFWGEGEAPLPEARAEEKVWKTEGVLLTLSDAPGTGGLTLEVGPPVVALPLRAVLGAEGIELSHGASSVRLTAAGVSINDGAFEVT